MCQLTPSWELLAANSPWCGRPHKQCGGCLAQQLPSFVLAALPSTVSRASRVVAPPPTTRVPEQAGAAEGVSKMPPPKNGLQPCCVIRHPSPWQDNFGPGQCCCYPLSGRCALPQPQKRNTGKPEGCCSRWIGGYLEWLARCLCFFDSRQTTVPVATESLVTPTHGFETLPPPEQWISALRDMILGAFAVIMSDEWRRLGNMVAVGVLWATNKPATVRSHLFLVRRRSADAHQSSRTARDGTRLNGEWWPPC